MTKLAALFWFALSLFGCNPHDQTVIVQSSSKGQQTLRSEVDIVHGIATFRCVASSSGVCHYAIYADNCRATAGCRRKPLHAFGLPVGQRLVDTDQPPGFVHCVGVSADTVQAECAGGGSTSSVAAK
ncbi:MAG TPA: hypothetical protein VJ722_02640 [Rhodanobacteraceae bacterium]|nr:hypothetical protein [Rhodanobacteraceae bacterium]